MKNIAVISGASSGIGKQFVLSLKDHGRYDEVWLIARGKQALEKTASEIDIPARILPLDLTKMESFETYRQALEEEKPNIALLINASGFGIFDSIRDGRLEDLIGMTDLNCRALVAMTKISLDYMSRGSKIMQIASMAALQPIPYIGVYGASKAYVLSFSRALNSELKKDGIQCMAICPYWTKTKFFDRAINPEKKTIVKKYVVMYEPEMIVSQAWKDLARGKDKSIYGFIARGQALLCKILPHSLVMKIWKKQQSLD